MVCKLSGFYSMYTLYFFYFFKRLFLCSICIIMLHQQASLFCYYIKFNMDTHVKLDIRYVCMYVCVYIYQACPSPLIFRLRNDLYCVGWALNSTHSLTHSPLIQWLRTYFCLNVNVAMLEVYYVTAM